MLTGPFLRRAAPAFLAALCAGALPAQNLPDGPGKAELSQACTKCHDVNQVVARKRTASDWSMTLDKMVTQGATPTDAQYDAILNYLIQNYRKPMNVNLASAAGLRDEYGFTDAEGAALVAYRGKNGAFRSAEDMKKVPGVDPTKVDAGKDWMAFQ